jgi:pyruvate dehydrogenase E2 component (dihydrolipoamide acetyltransferase)
MPTAVIMPKVDMVMEHGTIVRWLRQEGQPVTAGEPLFEIETDKATMEVEAPASGVLGPIRAGPGETVPVATVVAVILAPGEEAAAIDAPLADRAAAPSPPSLVATAPGTSAPQDRRPPATPLARRLARMHGLGLEAVRGSGPGGRIQRRDIEAYLAARNDGAPITPSPPAAVAPVAEPPASSAPLEGGMFTPLRGVRKVVAERMAQAALVPQFALQREIDATRLLAVRERVPGRPSLTAIIARAVAPLLLRHPALNSSFRDGGIFTHASVHLGIAMDSDGRLLVPVIRDAQRRTLAEIATALDDLKRRAAARQLTPADLSGSTFSISNLGMFGVDQFTALVNPPEAAILAVGRVIERGVNIGGQLALQPRMVLTLSADHRVVDGATAARFLADLCAALEEPYLLL